VWKLKHNCTQASVLFMLLYLFHSPLAQLVLHRMRERDVTDLLRHAGSEKWKHQSDCPVTVSSHQRGECWTLEPLHCRLPVTIQPSHTHTHHHQNPSPSLHTITRTPLHHASSFFILTSLYLRLSLPRFARVWKNMPELTLFPNRKPHYVLVRIDQLLLVSAVWSCCFSNTLFFGLAC